MRRVVVTGMGALSPLGLDVASLWEGLAAGRSGMQAMPGWQGVPGLQARVAGLVPAFDPKQIPRPLRRTMGRVSLLAALACSQAAADAGLSGQDLASERTGLIFGSTLGSPAVMEEFFVRYAHQGFEQTPGTDFLKVMGHTTAVNAALVLGVTGRVESLSAACATSAQCLGSGYEAVRDGRCDLVLAGGAEELHPTTAGTFDILGAASRTREPEQAPRPFAAERDGLVLAEGAGALVLEEYGRARGRGAKIYAELAGYATVCSAGHMTAPSAKSMQDCIQRALAGAGLQPADLTAVNAHATGTRQGDAAEAEALLAVLGGRRVPVTAFKGHIGHTLAASGALEAIGLAGMLVRRTLWPIRNLGQPLPEGAGLDFVAAARPWQPGPVLKNNFAFGGINASLVLAPVEI